MNVIYQKLIAPSRNVEMVKACEFFSCQDELEMLQNKVAKIIEAARKQPVSTQRRK